MEYLPLTPESIELLKKQLEPTNMEKFLKICLDALDTDVTPKDLVSDEFSCAEVVSTLIQKLLPDFRTYASTQDLDAKLFLDKRFKRLNVPERGCIWVSPRTKSTFGHSGVQISNEIIASNNSFGVFKGKFTGNYNAETWKKEFEIKRGLKTYYYKLAE